MRYLEVWIAILSVLPVSVVSFPGGKFKEAIAEIQARAAAPITSPEDSNELIGDLVSPGPSTTVGKVCHNVFIKVNMANFLS
jgi:hypothetical protein